MDFIKESQFKIIEIVNGTDFFFIYITLNEIFKRLETILKHVIKVKD